MLGKQVVNKPIRIIARQELEIIVVPMGLLYYVWTIEDRPQMVTLSFPNFQKKTIGTHNLITALRIVIRPRSAEGCPTTSDIVSLSRRHNCRIIKRS